MRAVVLVSVAIHISLSLSLSLSLSFCPPAFRWHSRNERGSIAYNVRDTSIVTFSYPPLVSDRVLPRENPREGEVRGFVALISLGQC